MPTQQAARSRILKVAISRFSERGYHQANMDEIARAARCSHAMLALLYPSKSALFSAALAAAEVQRTADLPILRILRDEPDFERAAAQVTEAIFGKMLDRTNARLRVFGYLERPDLMRVHFEASNIHYFTGIADRLRRERSRGRVRKKLDCDSAAAALMFIVGFRRIFGYLGNQGFPSFKLKGRDAKHFVDVWLHGVVNHDHKESEISTELQG